MEEVRHPRIVAIAEYRLALKMMLVVTQLTLNIRELIKSASAVFDGDAIRINCVLSADASAFLNPEHVIKALRKSVGILSSENLTEEYYSIMRESAYTDDMSEFR